jgi:aspartokinase
MVTIARTVEKIIERKPFLQEALVRGIVNVAALADEIIPEVEKEMGQKVKFSAVMMAIRRLGEKLEKTVINRVKFDKNSDINIRSDLYEITLKKIPGVQTKISKLYELINAQDNDILTVTQGFNEITLITNKRNKPKLKKVFKSIEIKSEIEDIASITINIPPEAIESVGLFYIATKALTWENINAIEVVSTFTELTFIIKEDDAAKAFDTLKRLIKEQSD